MENNFDLVNWLKYINKWNSLSTSKCYLHNTFWNVKKLFYRYDKITQNTIKNNICEIVYELVKYKIFIFLCFNFRIG